MKRTQLYLEDDVWRILEVLAKQSKCTVSHLVRQAIRERYVQNAAGRKEALRSVLGLWKDRTDLEDTEPYVRGLRRGSRLQRIAQ